LSFASAPLAFDQSRAKGSAAGTRGNDCSKWAKSKRAVCLPKAGAKAVFYLPFATASAPRHTACLKQGGKSKKDAELKMKVKLNSTPSFSLLKLALGFLSGSFSLLKLALACLSLL